MSLPTSIKFLNEKLRWVTNVWYKRWWWSRKTIIKKDYVAEGGIAAIFNMVVTPHMKSFHSCVTWSDKRPPREIPL